jgi:hypothetical protein
MIAVTGAAVCGVMAALLIAARRAPLAAAMIGLSIFGGKWLYDIAQDRSMLHLGLGLALRALILLAFVAAVRAGLNVRRLRAQPALNGA